MTDLQTAKFNLAGHAVCLCKNGACISSDKRGIAPMMDFMASGLNLAGYSVADIVVGKAAALLFAKSGIKSVYAKTLSRSGKKILELYGIKYEYETLTERIINRSGTDICPMEKAVSATNDPFEAYDLLKKAIKSL